MWEEAALPAVRAGTRTHLGRVQVRRSGVNSAIITFFIFIFFSFPYQCHATKWIPTFFRNQSERREHWMPMMISLCIYIYIHIYIDIPQEWVSGWCRVAQGGDTSVCHCRLHTPSSCMPLDASLQSPPGGAHCKTVYETQHHPRTSSSLLRQPPVLPPVTHLSNLPPRPRKPTWKSNVCKL